MLKEMNYVIKEHVQHFDKILILSRSSFKKDTIGTTFGVWWVLIKDIIFFAAYATFMTLMFSGQELDGMPRLLYLVTGLIPWYFLNEVISTGVRVIKKNKGIFTKIKFPISIIPTYETLAIFYRRMFSYIILIVIYGFYVFKGEASFSDINLFLVIYYMFSSLALMICFNLFISGFVAISKDFNELYMAFTRILFYFVPVIWSFDRFDNHFLTVVLKLNPLNYLLSGFRDAFVHGNMPSLDYTLYFWAVTVIFFVLGSFVQYRLRRLYADFL